MQGDDLDFALAAEVTTLKAVFVVGYQAERGVYANTEGPMVVDWLDVVTHGHGDERNHVAVIAATIVRGGACVADVSVCVDHRNTAGDLFALDARHAGRVAKNGGCVVGRGRSPGKT
ncbi:hypothetical protein D3C78_1277060 [compost metagenome]